MRIAVYLLALTCLSFTTFKPVSLTISGPNPVCQGTTPAFHATLSGFSGTPTYRWTKNGIVVHSNVRTPDSSVLEITVYQNGDVISCTAGGVTSNSITITVQAAQAFSLGGSVPGMFQCPGSFITLNAGGNLPCTFSWSQNGSSIPGADSSSHVVQVVSAAQLKAISVSASCTASCVTNPSQTFSFTNVGNINVPASVTPTIAITPSPGASVCAGGSVTFTSAITNGGTAPQYNWLLNGSPVSTASSWTQNSPVTGQTVSCNLFSNVSCATSSSVSSNVVTLAVTPVRTLGITIAGNDSVCQGGSAFFHATVTNSNGATINYQWQRNGVTVHSDIVTPDSSVYGTTRLQTGTVIDCIASTTAACFTGPVTSNNDTGVVQQPVAFTVGVVPEGMFYCPGHPVIFSAFASAPASYTWTENGTIISGATGSQYTLPAATLPLLQGIAVSANATGGGCLSNFTATATESGHTFQQAAYVVPSVTLNESGATPATFTAAGVNAGAAPVYLWQLNGVTVQQGGPSYTPAGVSPGTAYTIVCTMTPSQDVCVSPGSVCVSIPYYFN